VDLAQYLAILRRRALVVLLCLIAGAAGGWYAGHHPQKEYQATSRSFVNVPVGRGSSVQETLAGTEISGNIIDTYAEIATSRNVVQRMVTTLGLKESVGSVQRKLSSSVRKNTFLIDLTARDNDPRRAQLLADTAAIALRDTVAELEKGKADPVQAEVVDNAGLPGAPVSPKPKTDLALGLVLGLLAGLLAAAVLEALDRTIKTTAQGEATMGAPALGLVPRRRDRRRAIRLDMDAIEAGAEPYRAIRTAIRFLDPDQPIRTLLVTSATPGDGKTTTAASLAVAFALGGERVIVVDADLRRARLAEFYGLATEAGLTSVVMRRVALSEVLQPIGERLSVLAAGELPPNPAEILGSQTMNHLLQTLSERSDLVIFDTPPVLPVTDAVVLSAQVDAVLMVARYGRTLRHSASESARRLEAVGANVVGFVLNALPPSDSRGYYADYSYVQRRKQRRARRRQRRQQQRQEKRSSRKDAAPVG
jgi:succinoglycan biosynthesis transport protein ExoP